MEKCEEKMLKEPGFRSRVTLSIITVFGWLIFLIVWLTFYAGIYNIYQNLAVIVVSVLVFLAVMGSSWASWGMKYGPAMERKYRQYERPVKRAPVRKKKPRPRKR